MFTENQISKIVTSQLDSLLWSAGEICDENGETTLERWEDFYRADDATPKLVAQLAEELHQWEDVEFYGVAIHDAMVKALDTYVEHFDSDWLGQFGHDLALTRNGHGAGFWDRGLGDAGDALTDWAESLGTLHIFHGSDSIHPEKWEGKFHAE